MFQAQIMGTVGAPAETKTFNNGNTLTRVSVAISQGYYSKDQKKWVDSTPATVWVSVQTYKDRPAYVMSTLNKGDNVLVTGMFEVYEYQDKNGQPRTGYRMTADMIAVVPKKPKNIQPGTPQFSSGYNNPSQYTPRVPQGAIDDPWSAGDEVTF